MLGVKLLPSIVPSFRCKLLSTSFEDSLSLHHTSSMAPKSMKAMKAMKAMKTAVGKEMKAEAMKANNKAMKKTRSAMKVKKVMTQAQTSFEIVVSICRRCQAAQEIVRAQGPVQTLREYYCTQCGSPVELHGVVID